MEISCDIIRDLLPLYAEDLTSEASNRLVDDHLCGCDACVKELAALKKPQKVPVETDISSLKRVEETIRRRKVLTVMAVLMTVATLIVTGMTWLLTPYHLTAEEAVEGVELRADGGLAIDYASGISGMGGQGIFDTDNYGIICHTNRYDWYQAKQKDRQLGTMTEEELKHYIAELYDVEECTQKELDRFCNVHVEYGTWEAPNGEWFSYPSFPEDSSGTGWKQVYDPADRNFWYIDSRTGDGELLIWDGGKEMPSSVIMLTTYAYGYVFWGCLIFAALFYVISRGIDGVWKEVLTRIPMILACLATSILLVTGGQLTTLQYNLSGQWNEAIYMEALVLSLTALLWYQLHRLNKWDKGL